MIKSSSSSSRLLFELLSSMLVFHFPVFEVGLLVNLASILVWGGEEGREGGRGMMGANEKPLFPHVKKGRERDCIVLTCDEAARVNTR